MRIAIFRRYRGSWFRTEWHNHAGVTYLMLSISNPRRHAWWAVMMYIYLRGA